MCCFFKSKYERKIGSVIQNLRISDRNKKKNLIKRYVSEVSLYSCRVKRTGCLYYSLNSIITVGSIILPALLSIQNNDSYDQNDIYWLAWILSIIITISNGFLQLFSINTNYILYCHMKEKLITEGWRYINLCGKYKNKTHESAYQDFCHRIEELKMSQLDKELKELKTDEDSEAPEITRLTPQTVSRDESTNTNTIVDNNEVINLDHIQNDSNTFV
jgi:hypothetical protein